MFNGGDKMSKKKYYFIMIPIFIVGLFLLFYLPENLKPFVLLIPIVLGITYYVSVKEN